MKYLAIVLLFGLTGCKAINEVIPLPWKVYFEVTCVSCYVGYSYEGSRVRWDEGALLPRNNLRSATFTLKGSQTFNVDIVTYATDAATVRIYVKGKLSIEKIIRTTAKPGNIYMNTVTANVPG